MSYYPFIHSPHPLKEISREKQKYFKLIKKQVKKPRFPMNTEEGRKQNCDYLFHLITMSNWIRNRHKHMAHLTA